jgi:hypothetical protein
MFPDLEKRSILTLACFLPFIFRRDISKRRDGERHDVNLAAILMGSFRPWAASFLPSCAGKRAAEQ